MTSNFSDEDEAKLRKALCDSRIRAAMELACKLADTMTNKPATAEQMAAGREAMEALRDAGIFDALGYDPK